MCLLTFFPAGRMPDVHRLHTGSIINEDGHGYAIVAGDRLIVGKNLDAADLINEFAEVRAEYLDGPAMFHSRFSTHGKTNVENCHPFHVGGDPLTVMAHNGVLPNNVHPGKKDNRSDTRIAAEDFIPSLGHLNWRKTRQRVTRWMTPFNKIVVLTVNPNYGANAYILNEKAGVWDEGIWYSNDGYLPSKYTYTYVGGTGWPVREEEDDGGWPYEWTHCEDCGESYDNCDCRGIYRGGWPREPQPHRTVLTAVGRIPQRG